VPTQAKFYICAVSGAGIAAIAYGFLYPPWPHDPIRFGVYFLLSLVAAALKVRLPGLTGTMSIGFVFVLLGIVELSLQETMAIACAGVAVQCLWRAKTRPAAEQVLFSVSTVAIALVMGYGAAHLVRWQLHAESVSIGLAVAACVYFTANSLLVAGVLSLVKRERFGAVWQQCYLFAFPYYLVGGAVAGAMAASGRQFGWKPALLILPVMGMVFQFYRMYLARLTMAEAGIAAQSAGLHAVQARSA